MTATLQRRARSGSAGTNPAAMVSSARVLDDAESVADAVERYAARYREPRPNPERVVIAIDVRSVLGNL